MPERKLVAAYDDTLPLSEPAQFFIKLMLDKL